MGAQREDTDPSPKGGTEPGIGPAKAQPANGAAPETPPPVDFDALHAALGNVEDPVIRRSSPDMDPNQVATPPPVPAPRVAIGESQGRSSAQYASARPHTIPPTRAPDEPPDIPAVIVASDDTVPSAPPAMTTPLTSPLGAVPPPGHHPSGSGPHAAAASSPSYPNTPPQPFASSQRLPPQPTIRMPERPRRPKSPTIVVRKRGPSTVQKLAAFMAMLLLVTAVGIAVIIWRRPTWLGIEVFPLGGGSASSIAIPSAGIPSPTGTLSAITSAAPPASGSASASASSSGSVRPPPPRLPRPPHTAH